MAYNDTKNTGDNLTATEWNNMVLHMEDETTSHAHSGAVDDGQKVDGGDVINTPAGNIAATDIQAAINELDTEKATPADITADIGVHTALPNAHHAQTHTFASHTGEVAIADGGTGQITAQLAINALSAVSGATNEYVLTKDTGTGNATWKYPGGIIDNTQSCTNLLKNGDFESWISSTEANEWTEGGTGNLTRSVDEKIGTYALSLVDTSSFTVYITQVIDDYERYQSREVTFGCWIKSTSSNTTNNQIEIDDGVGQSTVYYSGSTNWEFIKVTRTINAAATKLDVEIQTKDNLLCDGAILVEGPSCPAFSPKPLEDDGLTLEIDSINNKATFGRITVYTPSSDTAITAAGGITVTNRIMRVAGSGGAIDITANPQIVAGTDGEIVIIQGTHDTNTVKLDDGTGLALNASITLAAQDNISLMYDSGDSEWIETGRTTVV